MIREGPSGHSGLKSRRDSVLAARKFGRMRIGRQQRRRNSPSRRCATLRRLLWSCLHQPHLGGARHPPRRRCPALTTGSHGPPPDPELPPEVREEDSALQDGLRVLRHRRATSGGTPSARPASTNDARGHPYPWWPHTPGGAGAAATPPRRPRPRRTPSGGPARPPPPDPSPTSSRRLGPVPPSGRRGSERAPGPSAAGPATRRHPAVRGRPETTPPAHSRNTHILVITSSKVAETGIDNPERRRKRPKTPHRSACSAAAAHKLATRLRRPECADALEVTHMLDCHLSN